MVKSIKIHTCDWNNAHTYDKVELKIENSKGECNTHQLSNRKNFVYGDKDIFNDNKAALNECFDWPINGNITVTVSKWGTDDWGFCWVKVISQARYSKIYYCENSNNYHMSTSYPKTIKMACGQEGM